jgi:hypothetical protein
MTKYAGLVQKCTYSDYLLYYCKRTKVHILALSLGRKAESVVWVVGAQITCFTSTKVHTLTAEELRGRCASDDAAATRCFTYVLLALLVQKYTY